jgi:hypothetical protein
VSMGKDADHREVRLTLSLAFLRNLDQIYKPFLCIIGRIG